MKVRDDIQRYYVRRFWRMKRIVRGVGALKVLCFNSSKCCRTIFGNFTGRVE